MGGRVAPGQPDEVHDGERRGDGHDGRHGEHQELPVDPGPSPRVGFAHLGRPRRSYGAAGVAVGLAAGLGVRNGTTVLPVGDAAPATRLNTYTPSRAKTDW